MPARNRILTVGFAAVGSAACLAAIFTWTNGTGDRRWDSCGNWEVLLAPYCYPQMPSDTAIFPTSLGGWDVFLVDEEIGDLMIQNPTVLRFAEGQEGQLSVASLVIVAPSYVPGQPDEFVVWIQEGCIETRE